MHFYLIFITVSFQYYSFLPLSYLISFSKYFLSVPSFSLRPLFYFPSLQFLFFLFI